MDRRGHRYRARLLLQDRAARWRPAVTWRSPLDASPTGYVVLAVLLAPVS
ncbi:MAG: hypothetical protein L0H84_20355 [Pseudonocardia sp.]|nr:hypothetical protein [Pseudonocardia sp.]